MNAPKRLRMYVAYVNIRRVDEVEGDFWERSRVVESRVPMPVFATSVRHAKALALKAWGPKSNPGVLYIGFCDQL